MLRKYIARLLAFALVLNLVLCVPLSVAADETEETETETFDADPVSVETTTTEDGTQTDVVVVTQEVPAETVYADTSDNDSGFEVKDQTVSVEIPVEEATILTPVEGTLKVNENEDGIEYDTTVSPEEGATTQETIHVEESYDLTADLIGAEQDASGQLTDIEYGVSLDRTVNVEADNTGSSEPETQAQTTSNSCESSQPEEHAFKVNLSVNGMEDDPTRVEHTYWDNEGKEQTEYYYNEANGKDETDTSKKYFTVIKETAENVVNKAVSLWTNFLDFFHITNDAFENQDTKEMSTTLDEAVNGADNGDTVTMLRDYTTDKSAEIEKSDNVTLDLNGKAYTDKDPNLSNKPTETDNAAIKLTGDKQELTIQNGTINSGNRGVNVTGKDNKVTINQVEINSDQRGVQVSGANNNVTVSGTTIDAGDVGVGDFNVKNTIKIEKSDVFTTGDGSLGVYHNGSYGGADIQLIGSFVWAGGKGSLGIYVSGSKSSTTSNGMNNLTLTDSTIGGSETGVEVKYTNVTINNSELLGFGTPPEYVGNNNGTTTSGAALAVTDNRTFKEDGTVKSSDNTAGTITINSGYFYGHKDIDNIFVAAKINADDPQATIHLNGGRFVNAAYLYKYTDAKHAVVSSNDGSDYPYAVVGADAVPARPGYNFLGYKDDQGKDITLKEAIAKQTIAYAQWEKIVEPSTTEDPVKTPTTEAPKDTSAIIVEADAKGNNVDVAIKGNTAVVTVSTPAGEAAAVSEVTIPSISQLQEQGVKNVKVQVEKDVTLELGVAKNDKTVADSVKITREEEKLVITDSNKSEIVIHVEELKAVATKPVSIKLDSGVLTVNLGNGAYKLNVKDALATSKSLTVKLENGVLKLYDSKGNLIEEVKI